MRSAFRAGSLQKLTGAANAVLFLWPWMKLLARHTTISCCQENVCFAGRRRAQEDSGRQVADRGLESHIGRRNHRLKPILRAYAMTSRASSF